MLLRNYNNNNNNNNNKQARLGASIYSFKGAIGRAANWQCLDKIQRNFRLWRFVFTIVITI